ncbi:centrosome-associated protein 350-like [Neophocaena asiaeorientalis asiaeorientalis]|uniref:Centrosome-associated protein 350-like n=1 Tax=Neophocaena asiaeorientalis asiaeorientalis TaxID=1706337 RepID=A0A341CU44_NEOAA|nr:centrosome-associated protein 350-like [Neophocaena asiaeorientalis asiaeorientalis]
MSPRRLWRAGALFRVIQRMRGLLSNIWQKSLSFLESLKLGERKQEQTLALLRQEAELERLMEKCSTQARPGMALELEQPQVCVDLELQSSGSTVTARPRCGPLPAQKPVQERKPDQTPSQLPLARLYPWDNPILRWSQTRPRSVTPPQFSHCTLQMLEQSLREEELRAQHQAALLRLREKTRAELAWLEHRQRVSSQSISCPRYLNSTGSYAAPVASAQKQQQALGNLERELMRKLGLGLALLGDPQLGKGQGHLEGHREGPRTAPEPGFPPDTPRRPACVGPGGRAAVFSSGWFRGRSGTCGPSTCSSPQERKLLLQHQKDILSLQRSTALLRQEFRAWSRLPQSSSPEVKATREEGPGTSQQPEGPALGLLAPPPRTSTPHRPGSQRPRRSPENPQVPRLLTKQEDRTPPAWAASAGDGHLQPPRLAWGEDTPVASGRPDAGGQLAESHGHMGQGDPQTKPSPQPAGEKTSAPTESRASNFQGRSRRSPSAGGPLSPREASCFQQVVEGSRSRAGSELGLDFASSPVEEPVAMESCSGEQRLEAWRAARAGGALGPGDGLARTSCPLAERPSRPAGAPCAGPGPPCTPAHAHVLLNLIPPLWKQRCHLMNRPKILGGGSMRGPSREHCL